MPTLPSHFKKPTFTKKNSLNTNNINNKRVSSISNSYTNSKLNPIIISTIGASAISWIIAFAGSIAASQNVDFFPTFTWWGLVFELFVVIILPILYFFNMIYYYRDFMLAVLIIAFVYTSNSANNLIYYSISSASASSAGFILLSIVNFLWLFYLGSMPNAPLIKFINKYGQPLTSLNYYYYNNNNNNNNNNSNNRYNNYDSNMMQSTTHFINNDLSDIENDDRNVHELSGFEKPADSMSNINNALNNNSNNNFQDSEFKDSAYLASGINPIDSSNPDITYNNNNNNNNSNSNSNNNNNSNSNGGNNNEYMSNNPGTYLSNVDNTGTYTGTGFTLGTNFTGITSATQYMEDYPILVRGLYNYKANPDDVNELSFSKGEIFRVKNTDGNWWQGKNKKGEIGMCPSNYLEVVN